MLEENHEFELAARVHPGRGRVGLVRCQPDRRGRASISTLLRNTPATACGSPTVCCLSVPMSSKVDRRTRTVACTASAKDRQGSRTGPLRDGSPVCWESPNHTVDGSVEGSYHSCAVGGSRGNRRSRRREQRRGTR